MKEIKETIFEATVHYNDMVGSVSADNSDKTSITQWLCERDLIKSGQEQVIGIQLHPDEINVHPENNGEELVNPVNVTILLIPLGNIGAVKANINSGKVPLQLRRIDTRMALPEFFSLFKQINLTISLNQCKNNTQGSGFKGILEGVKYQYEMDSKEY
jgi:hypothetical protein